MSSKPEYLVKQESLDDLLHEGLNNPSICACVERMTRPIPNHAAESESPKVLTEVNFRKGRYKPRESDQFVSKFKLL